MAAALCYPSVAGDGGLPGAGDAETGRLSPAAGGDAAAHGKGALHPIHFLYGHLHNSIRTELDNLSSWVLALEADNEQDLLQRLLHLKERYHFLEQVYKYHSSVEDEVGACARDTAIQERVCHLLHASLADGTPARSRRMRGAQVLPCPPPSVRPVHATPPTHVHTHTCGLSACLCSGGVSCAGLQGEECHVSIQR